MISHVCVGVADFDRAFDFYSAVMAELGLPLRFRNEETHWAGWMPPDGGHPRFYIAHPYDGEAPAPGNGQMTAFLAPNRETVRRCYSAAIAAGAKCEGPPGLRPQYHPHYYGAYFRDPDGNKLGLVCHDPE